MRPLDPEGGARLPWKSLKDRSWIGWKRPPDGAPWLGLVWLDWLVARAGEARPATHRPAMATPAMRRVERDMGLPLVVGCCVRAPPSASEGG